MITQQTVNWPKLVSFIMVLLGGSAAAVASESADPLFQTNDTLEVVIEAPLATLIVKRPKDDYLPGILRYSDGAEIDTELDLEITTRGHSRHDYCDFPPLWLNFKKSQTEGTLFDGQDKLKLVVHCEQSSKFEQFVLREYLVYRLLNLITDNSFRVRLLRVNYVDTEGRRSDITRYAYLIEHKNRLGKRIGRDDMQIERTMVSAIQPDHLNLTSIFAYMVGNTDFSPVAGHPRNECCHNYVLFTNEVDPIMVIPYDFDQAGLVDAPYALPAAQFGIKTVRQRVYRGRCVNNEYVEASLQQIRDSRDEIFELIAQQEGLQDSTRKKVSGYIEDFFKLIDNPKKVKREILDECV